MTTPTDRQLQILRLLAAGVHLEEPEGAKGYRLVLNDELLAIVQRPLQRKLQDGGWIAPDPRRAGTWTLTAAGRARAEVGVFVRHFVEVA